MTHANTRKDELFFITAQTKRDNPIVIKHIF